MVIGIIIESDLHSFRLYLTENSAINRYSCHEQRSRISSSKWTENIILNALKNVFSFACLLIKLFHLVCGHLVCAQCAHLDSIKIRMSSEQNNTCSMHGTNFGIKTNRHFVSKQSINRVFNTNLNPRIKLKEWLTLVLLLSKCTCSHK